MVGLLKNKSEKRLDDSLFLFNQKYEKIIPLIKNKSEKENFIEPLKILHGIWVDGHSITKPFKCLRNYKETTDVSWLLTYRISPLWTSNSELTTAVHILNKTLTKVDISTIYQEGNPILKQPRLDVEKRCREYLSNLPDKITLQNMVSFTDLPKKYNIPEFGYNTNASLTERLLEKQK